MNRSLYTWLISLWRPALAIFVPVALVGTVLAGGLYGVVQSLERLTVDDAPVAAANRAVHALAAGQQPSQVAAGLPVDLATDPGPFVTVHGADGAVLASTARLDGAVPTVPSGVLSSAADGTDRVTWQPRADVREAVIAMPWRGPGGHGVVVAGASLQRTEQRETDSMLLSALVWVVAMGAAAVGSLAGAALLRGRTPA